MKKAIKDQLVTYTIFGGLLTVFLILICAPELVGASCAGNAWESYYSC